ncbi:MAG: O-succinylbenzoic acid--CoA ligase [Allomuricauda sp.]|nr:MAG: O-succinylbenzoic acid--CoA ligase [Allomuricauda sp.]
MSKIWHNIHPDFKLNGEALTLPSLQKIARDLIAFGEAYEIEMGHFLTDWLNENDNLSIKTSGSTGEPKTISIKKVFCINSAKATAAYFQLAAGQTALLCLSSAFIAGKMMLVRAMVLGLELDTTAPNSKPLGTTTKTYDFAAMVPMQVMNSLPRLHQIKKLIIGGAPVSKLLRQQLHQSSTQIFETYGMTETVTHIAVKPLNSDKVAFETLADISVEKDERNCLVIKAPKIAAQKVVTNDLVDLIDEHHFIWLGRFDNIINSGGIKLIPEQIEAKLAEVISDRFFVAGMPHESLGEQLVLLVEGRPDIEFIQQTIEKLDSIRTYEKPKKIISVIEFISTPTGKVSRLETLKALEI